jgi:hypothetical protein
MLHDRSPSVERLYFHIPDQQCAYFNDDEDIESVLLKTTIKESIFTAWIDANKKYTSGRNLTYTQFVAKFVYVRKDRCWRP